MLQASNQYRPNLTISLMPTVKRYIGFKTNTIKQQIQSLVDTEVPLVKVYCIKSIASVERVAGAKLDKHLELSKNEYSADNTSSTI
jgi:hypothetical protein